MIVGWPFSNRLQFFRKQLSLTQTQLAQRSGLNRNKISRFETGEQTPSLDKLESLADAIGVTASRLARETTWSAESVAIPRPSIKRKKYVPGAAKPARVRFEAAYEMMPELCQAIELSARQRSDFRGLSQVLQGFVLDSGLEGLFVMRLVEGGARPIRASLMAMGFRSHAIIDEDTYLLVGDCPRDGLTLEIDGRPLHLFPQVSVVSQPKPRRLDFLCQWGHDWLDLEIDGSGHDASKDVQRRKELGLPTVRLSETEVKSALPLRLVHQKILACGLWLRRAG